MKPTDFFYDKIQALIEEMDELLESLQNESIRNNTLLREKQMSRINDIQEEIHELKVQRIIHHFDGSPNKAA